MTRSTLTHRLEALRPMTVPEWNAFRTELPERFRADIDAVMQDAMKQGLPPGDAAEITAIAAADLLRGMYGNSMCRALAQKIIDRAGQPIAGGQ
jgi:hypothetical protein